MATVEKKRFGVTFVGLLWGIHFCQFYKTQKDYFDNMSGPYFMAWDGKHFLTEEDAKKFLAKALTPRERGHVDVQTQRFSGCRSLRSVS